MSTFKLYTKTGDKGTTSLYDMRRVGKHECIFEVLGDLDELSAHIGMVLSFKNDFYHKVLRNLQSKLLDIGSDIATVKNRNKVVEITESDVKQIENYIDDLQSQAPPLREFILPGFQPVDAQIHICRAVSRRLERHLWLMKKTDEEHPTKNETYIYINRLSDFFFALARAFTKENEITRSSAQQLKD